MTCSKELQAGIKPTASAARIAPLYIGYLLYPLTYWATLKFFFICTLTFYNMCGESDWTIKWAGSGTWAICLTPLLFMNYKSYFQSRRVTIEESEEVELQKIEKRHSFEADVKEDMSPP